MEPIRNIAIVGAGAMGAAYAAMFSDAVGFNVSFVARGTRYERLKNQSITVNERLYNVGVIHPDKVSTPADLVIVALKHHHLADAVGDIAALTGPDTAILSVMNGLESEETISTFCGMDKLVYAIAVGIDAVHENRWFTYANPGKIVFGPMADDGSGPDLERIREALDRAGIPNEVPPDILRAMWWKFMVNVGTNQASAVLRAPYGVFQSNADARDLMRSLMEEVVALAPEAGIDLGTKDVDEWVEILAKLSPAGKTSMLQDVEAGRKTEVALFAGRIVELGRKYNVPTPVNATIQRIIKVIESQSGH
jgi:2-dehydropantoate 2-reductase